MKFSVKKIICFAVIAIIIAACIVANVFATRYSRNITALLCGSGAEVDAEAGKFSSKLGDEIVKNVGAESTTLLLNENDALPLEENAKVNVFGSASADKNWIVTGSGSGTGVIDPQYAETFMSSLKGSGLQVNETLEKFYAARPATRGDKNTKPYELSEPAITELKQAAKDAKSWSDTAIVVLGRYAGETIDEIPLKYNGTNKTYLELTDAEIALFQYLKGEAKYEKIIVVINAANAMNLSFLKNQNYGIDACLWAGFTGQSGAWAIGRIINGKINPSGRTADIYPYFPNNADYDSVWANNRNVGSDLQNATKDMVEAEGIYYGYKWYETAAEEGFFKRTAYGSGYDGVVQFPFGYGLSYTDFKWNVKDVSLEDGGVLALDTEITLTVEVENVGTKAGRDVVELYFNPPYTSGGIEKASVNLLDFAKTKEIAPGEKDEVKLTFTAFDMASFDCWDLNKNGKTSWELDEGDYEITLRRDSHTVADDIMADGSNATITYNVASTLVYEKDPVGGGDIDTRLTGDGAYAGVSVDGTNVGLAKTNYLSRAEGFKNYNDTVKTRTAGPSRNHEKMRAAREFMNPVYETDEMPKTGSTETDMHLVTVEGGAKATLEQLNGKWGDAKPVYNTELIKKLAANYDGDDWDKLISQMTPAELSDLFTFGGFQTVAAVSIGKIKNLDYDGPAGFNLTALKGTWSGGVDAAEEIEKVWTVWPSESIVGCSWSKNLLLEMGLFMGMEAQNTNVSGWYAPGLNLHRSVYTNRNFEYYSEDAVLAGNLGANIVHGAKMNNLYCYMKHFVCCEYGKNPGDTDTWLTEQSLRENAMRVFEIAVKEGGGNAIMTAFNNVGPVWAGANYATCTQILRDEWGFRGTLLTDIVSKPENTVVGLFNHEQGLRSGQDIWLNHTLTPFHGIDLNSNKTMANCAQRAAHNIIWTSVDTYNYASTYDRSQLNEIFGDDGETELKYAIELSVRVAPTVNAWWIPVGIVLEVLVLGGCAVWAFFLLKPIFFKKKAAAEAENSEDKTEE